MEDDISNTSRGYRRPRGGLIRAWPAPRWCPCLAPCLTRGAAENPPPSKNEPHQCPPLPLTIPLLDPGRPQAPHERPLGGCSKPAGPGWAKAASHQPFGNAKPVCPAWLYSAPALKGAGRRQRESAEAPRQTCSKRCPEPGPRFVLALNK